MSAEQPTTGRDPTAPAARVEAALKQLRLAKAATDAPALTMRLDDALFATRRAEQYLEDEPESGTP